MTDATAALAEVSGAVARGEFPGSGMLAGQGGRLDLGVPRPCLTCGRATTVRGAAAAFCEACRGFRPPRCDCGNVAMMDPECRLCAGTGTLGEVVCQVCRRGPCPVCVVKRIIERVRHERDAAAR